MNKNTNALIWSSFDKIFAQGIQFIISIILARLLTPSDFGIVGIVVVFITVATLFIDSGLPRALIYKQNRTEEDFSTIFNFNFIISAFFCSILFLFSKIIADFYNIKELESIVKAFSIILIIDGCTIVPLTKLEINLNFKSKAKINIITIMFSGIIGIVLAYKGYGAWALVYMYLSRAIILNISLYFFYRWIPKMIISKKILKEMLEYSWKILVASITTNVIGNIYTILIGKLYSKETLGYYTRGLQFSEIISGTQTSIFQSVAFPVLCSLKNNKELLLIEYKKFIKLNIIITFPIIAMISVLSKPIILFLLTEKWENSIFILKWTALSLIFTPLGALNSSLLNALGRSDLYMKVDFLKNLLTLISVALSFVWGFKILILSRVVVCLFYYFINSYYPGKLIKYGAIDQIKDNYKIFFSTIVMYFYIDKIISFQSSNFFKIIIGGGSGIIIYILLLLIIKEEVLKNYMKKKKIM